MPDFRRYYIPNAIVFITTVTRERIPYLQSEEDIKLFWETIRRVQEIHPFHLLAYVILPDHFHWLMRADDPKGNFSKVIHSVKRNYTVNYKKCTISKHPSPFGKNDFGTTLYEMKTTWQPTSITSIGIRLNMIMLPNLRVGTVHHICFGLRRDIIPKDGECMANQ